MKRDHRRIERLSMRYSVYFKRANVTQTSIVLSRICSQDGQTMGEGLESGEQQSSESFTESDEQTHSRKFSADTERKPCTSTCISLDELDEPQTDRVFIFEADGQHPRPVLPMKAKKQQKGAVQFLHHEGNERKHSFTSVNVHDVQSQDQTFVTDKVQQQKQQMSSPSPISVSKKDVQQCIAPDNLTEELDIKEQSHTDTPITIRLTLNSQTMSV